MFIFLKRSQVHVTANHFKSLAFKFILINQNKNFVLRTGGGGISEFADMCGQGGRGSKKGKICADILYGWPIVYSFSYD